MSGGHLFDPDTGTVFYDVRPGVRTGDLPAARDAAVKSMSTVQENRRLILQLLFEHDWLTQFCPFVLMRFDPRYKQTAIGPRFKGLWSRNGMPLPEPLIEYRGKRQPREGAESRNQVSWFSITDAGRDYLRANWPKA